MDENTRKITETLNVVSSNRNAFLQHGHSQDEISSYYNEMTAFKDEGFADSFAEDFSNSFAESFTERFNERFAEDFPDSFVEGFAKGFAEGFVKGFVNGFVNGVRNGAFKEKLRIASVMKNSNYPMNDIMKLSGLTEEQIKSL